MLKCSVFQTKIRRQSLFHRYYHKYKFQDKLIVKNDDNDYILC